MSSTSILDEATIIAISASRKIKEKQEGLKKQGKEKQKEEKLAVDVNTINNMLTFLQARNNVDELLAYIMRQMKRGEIDDKTGKLLLSKLKDKDLKTALQLLGYVKWLHEALVKTDIDQAKLQNVRSFRELVNIFSSQ